MLRNWRLEFVMDTIFEELNWFWIMYKLYEGNYKTCREATTKAVVVRASSTAVTLAIGEPNEGEVQIADGSGTLRDTMHQVEVRAAASQWNALWYEQGSKRLKLASRARNYHKVRRLTPAAYVSR